MYVKVTNGIPTSYTIGQLRKDNPNTSFPKKISNETLAAYNIYPVLDSPRPTAGELEVVRQDGFKQDANGNWTQNYVVGDMFSDYTDDEGVTHTKAEQEAAYQAKLDADAKAAAISTINSDFEEEIAAVKEGYTEDEIKSWPQQVAEAQAYQADQTVSTPLLDAIVSQRGGTKDELVLRIATNATQYAQVFGVALGKKQKAIADLG